MINLTDKEWNLLLATLESKRNDFKFLATHLRHKTEDTSELYELSIELLAKLTVIRNESDRAQEMG